MISIVMSYYNRLPQLKYTLQTFTKSSNNNFEIIIVDDFSNEENSLKHIHKEFPSLNLIIVEMAKEFQSKNYCNPCVPYNVGFRKSKGDKIIIQNPECCHQGDVISYVDNNLTKNTYLSFHCWACTRPDLKELHQGKPIKVGLEEGKARWYNHETIRPFAYHFTSAITRDDLKELNGFDEAFSMGFNYDDTEFIERIKNKKMNIMFVSDPYVIHQYHGKAFNHPLNPTPTQDNKKIYDETVATKKIRADNKISI